jgi:hypothetical protein
MPVDIQDNQLHKVDSLNTVASYTLLHIQDKMASKASLRYIAELNMLLRIQDSRKHIKGLCYTVDHDTPVDILSK